MSYKAVIHLPREQKDVEKLMHEIALFRAEKTLKILGEWGVTPELLQSLLKEIEAKQGEELSHHD